MLSTSRCTGSLPAFGRGTSNVSARRLRVEWSGTASRGRAAEDGADQPLGLAQRQAEHGPQRQGRRDRQSGVAGLTAPAGARLSPPGLDRLGRKPHGQAAPGRRPASYVAQLVTRCRCFGMWCRRSRLALNGMAGAPLRSRARPHTSLPEAVHPGDPCNNVTNLPDPSEDLAHDPGGLLVNLVAGVSPASFTRDVAVAEKGARDRTLTAPVWARWRLPRRLRRSSTLALSYSANMPCNCSSRLSSGVVPIGRLRNITCVPAWANSSSSRT